MNEARSNVDTGSADPSPENLDVSTPQVRTDEAAEQFRANLELQKRIVTFTFIGLIVSALSMLFAGVQSYETVSGSGTADKVADAAQRLARAAQDQARAALAQVDLARAALDVQRQGVRAVRDEQSSAEAAEAARNRTLTLTIWDTNVGMENVGTVPLSIEFIGVASATTAKQAVAKLQRAQFDYRESARELPGGRGFGFNVVGKALAAVVRYRDARHRLHHSYACGVSVAAGKPSEPCKVQADD